jgi:hypothetical protein
MSEQTATRGLDDLLVIFQSDLREVRFPGVDVVALERAASGVEGARAEVGRARQLLDEAERALAALEEAQLQLGQRALAYARIFAEGQEALGARLAALRLDPVAQSSGELPPRRGRPPKARAGGPSLFALPPEAQPLEAERESRPAVEVEAQSV